MSWKNLAVVVCGVLLAGQVAAGVTFRQEVRNEGAREAREADVTTHVWIDGDAVKVEFVEIASNPMLARGSYVLIKGRDMFLVDPARKSYTRFDAGVFGDVLGTGSEMMEGMGMDWKIENPRVEKLLEQDGGSVAGYTTRHYRFRTTYTSTMTMPGAPAMRTDHETLEDLWVTTAVTIAGPPDFLSNLSGGAMGPQIQALAALEQQKPEGFPLKRVAVNSSKSRNKGMMGRLMNRGSGGDVKTTTTVVDLRETDIPASVFEIPAGYVEQDMMRRGPAMPDLSEGDD